MTDMERRGFVGAVERFFRLSEHGTTLRTEVLGGATTFATMAYIIVVNPAILQFAGLPVGPSTVATILTAVVGSLLMGLVRQPAAGGGPVHGRERLHRLRPGCPGASAGSCGWGRCSSAAWSFSLITLLGVRTWLANSISPSMKHSFAVGIGLFLAFIGLYQTGIVTSFVEGMPVPRNGIPRQARRAGEARQPPRHEGAAGRRSGSW